MVGDENRCPAVHQHTLEAMVPEVIGRVGIDCHPIGFVMRREKEKEAHQQTGRHRATGWRLSNTPHGQAKLLTSVSAMPCKKWYDLRTSCFLAA